MAIGPEIELFLKVLGAGLIGFVVGFERELMGSPAGDRTFSLVAIGSALFTVLSFEVFGGVGNDPGRIAANIVTGIGFLGGGMILKEGGTVRGLTTAAGIWAVAAVAMAVATDRYLLAILTAALIMVVFAVERVYSVKRTRTEGQDEEARP
jgi:putative Mg2+ transporter-C (MgtC) family protein